MAVAASESARAMAEKALQSGIDPRADGWAILALADEVAALRATIELGMSPQTVVYEAKVGTVEVAGGQTPAELAEHVAGSPTKTRGRSR